MPHPLTPAPGQPSLRGSSACSATHHRLLTTLLFTLLFTLFLASPRSHANPNPSPAASCPATFPSQPPRASSARRTLLDALQSLNDACQARADYHAYVGMLLLLEARPQDAALALEKALMLDPGLAGARIDYAQALAQQGELAAARQLVAEVARRPDLPAGLAPWLEQQQSLWRSVGWQANWQLALLFGAESNLNSSTGLRYLTLNLPGGPLNLELADYSAPRAGLAWRSELGLAARRTLGPGLLQLGLNSQQRLSPAARSTDQQLDLLHLHWLQPLGPGLLGLRSDYTHISISGRSAYRAQGWSSHYRLPLTALLPQPDHPPRSVAHPADDSSRCALDLGASSEERRYLANTSQNGSYQARLLGLDCQHASFNLQLRLQQGHDRPQHVIRLGGAQRRRDLGLALTWQPPPSLRNTFAAAPSPRLGYVWNHSHTHDQDIYSPLLGNQPRRLSRHSQRLTWQHPLPQLPGQPSLMLELERSRQVSNISLFGLDNDSLYLGLRWQD